MATRVNDKLFKEYVVNSETKLLEYLLITIEGKSRNNIKELLKNEQILVNGRSVTQFDHLLKKGDKVSVSPYRVKATGEHKCKLEIIYEDSEFIVINKPSGLLSVEDNKEKNKTAFNIMMEYVKEENPKSRIYVLHRIDKETSGVLVFAKNENIKNTLQDKWNEYITVREYTAVVEGHFGKKKDTIASYLTQGKNGLVFSTSNPREGQKSITHYEVLAEIPKYSLLKVNLDTGRKNQIRVHMKENGHNIVGDNKYDSNNNPLKRLGLHNRVLEFNHPINKKHYRFVAETPKEFLKMFNIKEIK